MNNYSHIHKDFQYLMLLTDAEREASLHVPFFIENAKTKGIVHYLDTLISLPKRDRMQNCLFIGEPNMGKTTIIKHFAKLHPDILKEDGDGNTIPSKPIIIAEAPPSATERGFYTSILDGFTHVDYRPTDTIAKIENQVFHLMTTCNVKMLIIDEFHNLLAGTAIKQNIILNIIKSMSNRLSIPIVAVGISKAETIIKRSPQMASRFETIELTQWKGNKDYVDLLRSFECRLPLKKPSKFDIKSNKKAIRLLSICDKNLGNLHKLLIECAKEAISTGEEEITLEIIEKFSSYTPTAGKSAKRVF